jgi:hypothetical protein
MRSAPRALALAALLACGCRLIADFPLGADADADADADTHADADTGADADADTDGDTDAVVARLVALRGDPRDEGPYPAGSSTVVTLDPAWEGSPVRGVVVGIEAQGGLVSLSNRPGASGVIELQVDENGELPDVRVTFPLDPWPYEVKLLWGTPELEERAPVDGVETLEVVEPVPTEGTIGGTDGEPITLVTGLRAELVDVVGAPFDFGVAGSSRLTSMTFARDAATTSLVVSGSAETCFFSTAMVPQCQMTRPAITGGDGPDDVHRVVFYESGDDARGLYLASFCGDEATCGGVYRLGADGVPTRQVEVSNTRSLDAAPSGSAFRTDLAAGLFFFGEGRLRHLDPASLVETVVCETTYHYPDSIALGDPTIYGRPYVFTAEDGAGGVTLARVTITCAVNSLFLTTTAAAHAPSLRPGPGAVFGHMVHVVTQGEVRLLNPGGSASTYALYTLLGDGGSGALDLVDVAAMPELEGLDAHPPGLYVLDGEWSDARLLRVFQDLD